MVKVEKEKLREIENLFHEIQDSMVIACIQGYMGDAYVDKLPQPTVGLIISGEYSFFAGDFKSEQAEWFIRNMFKINPCEETTCIFPDSEPGWVDNLMSVKENNPEIVERYGIAQKDYIFDEKYLKSYIDALPREYELKLFDEDLYQQAMAEEWSREFCETFKSREDYLERGFGYAVVHQEKLVAASSTMTVYDGGTETQVATHPSYRKKGLAMVSAAAFILECQKRGIRPCWDAANLISKKMALDLGYEYKGEYTTIHMSKNK